MLKPETAKAHPAGPAAHQRAISAGTARAGSGIRKGRKGLIQAKDVEMEDYRKQSAQVDGTIRNYEARIESTPVGIREYDELIRDRDLAKKDYEDLDRRLNSSEMSTALQNRQQGERLEQLDPPSLPQTPAQPKRPFMICHWDSSVCCWVCAWRVCRKCAPARCRT